MSAFAILGVIQHEVALPQLRRLIDRVKADAGDDCVVVCGASGLFAHASQLEAQVEMLFDNDVDLVFPADYAVARCPARRILADKRLNVIRPLNSPDTAPGVGCKLITVKGFSFWAVSLADNTGKMPASCPYQALEAFFRAKSDDLITLVNLHGTDVNCKKAFYWRYREAKSPIIWAGTGCGIADYNCVLSPNGSFFSADCGLTECENSIGSIPALAWWGRRFERIGSDNVPQWGALYSDVTILRLCDGKKPTNFIVKRIRV